MPKARHRSADFDARAVALAPQRTRPASGASGASGGRGRKHSGSNGPSLRRELGSCPEIVGLSTPEWKRRTAEHAENVRRGREACEREAQQLYEGMKERIAAEAKLKLKEQRMQKAAELKLKAEAEAAASAAARTVQQDRIRKPPTLASDEASPHTVMAQPAQRRCTELCGLRLVWGETECGQNQTPLGTAAAPAETYEQQARREGSLAPIEVDADAVDTAIRNGLVLVRRGGAYVSDGMNASKWYRACALRELASRIWVTVDPKSDRVVLQSDGGHGLAMVGGGMFNLVLQPTTANALPQMSAGQGLATALRITRPDQTPHNDHRYEAIDVVVREAVCSAFAALNGLSVPLYSIACYEGLSINRTLRYGSAYLTKRADMDLFRALEAQRDDFDFGRDCAYAVVDLVYRLSRCGVAFFDIKPANILVCIDGADVSYYLTDFDSTFFVRLPEQYDWHSLMLLNLAMLSAHVRNTSFGHCVAGWTHAVAPVLAQLIKYRSHYDGDWLFHARALRLEYALLEAHTPFDLQAYFAMMCTSYFYGDRLREASRPPLSGQFRWDLRSEQALRPEHMQKKQWPAEWPALWVAAASKPLIQQLVSFATEGCKANSAS